MLVDANCDDSVTIPCYVQGARLESECGTEISPPPRIWCTPPPPPISNPGSTPAAGGGGGGGAGGPLSLASSSGSLVLFMHVHGGGKEDMVHTVCSCIMQASESK